ncbi:MULTISPECIES: flagellar basal-body MS-ring/collar protein FliF [unclassified Serratia (in: enterobacteria)]|uniref:flagellar basal-body MS-ring/collar protein FliF n=1 Tax=unclassified Serratia (in: enterobacteria) TaxID=2647522 RepID=UPI0005007CE5|nr:MULTISPECIES: flagellar basal-body MS-ring/collar protein FliF [unclassified Serratia (in: enterobacteria)]KFK93574.1 flagellar M-ring protein FliF [Serratia sp. Ag2]KFK93861.1 flagellar M-ring protein FliF [Serratia sp. Ag1]
MNASASVTHAHGFQALWHRLLTSPKMPLLIAASAAVAIVVALLLWLKSPDYRVLYNNLSDRDGGAIVTQLAQMNIPYRLSENGSALLIPAEQVHETRLRLAQQGLPKGGAAGFELLDQEQFGISQFSEQINYQRALEGELSRTIESLGPVHKARVHLALPKPSLFVREQKAPSASVTLSLQPGRTLDDGQINAIVHMVSSSITGLPAANVTVVDQAGRLLTQPDGNGRDLNTAQLKYASEVENRYQRRIEAIIAPLVGSANVRAQVTALIDFTTREQTDEQYQPNQAPDKSAIRSKQLSQSEQLGGQLIGGVPGALSNQPSPPVSAPIEKPKPTKTPASKPTNANTSSTSDNQPQNTRRDETTNYELDRTIRHSQQKAGAVERLSVAVVINTQGTNQEGKPVLMSKEQLAQIESLVREAMGYSISRGDTLNVVNAPFNDVEPVHNELPFWQSQAFIEQVFKAGRYLLVLLVAWLLWRKLVRPQLRSRQTATAAAQVAAHHSADTSKPSQEELALRKKSQQRVSAEVQGQRIRDLADKDPRVVALVIRQWMSNEL